MRFNYKGNRLPLIEEFMRTGSEPNKDEAAYLNEFYTENQETKRHIPMLEVMANMRQRDFVEVLYQFEHQTRQIDEASRDHSLLAAMVAAGRLVLREAVPHPIDDDGPMDFLMAAGAAFACVCGTIRIRRKLAGGDESEADRLEAKFALDAARCVGLSAIVEVNAAEGVIDYAK